MNDVLYYGICPKAGCEGRQKVGDLAVDYGETYKAFCERCGSEMIVRCPKCQRPIMDVANPRKFNNCRHFGSPFKVLLRLAPQPPQKRPRPGGKDKPSK